MKASMRKFLASVPGVIPFLAFGALYLVPLSFTFYYAFLKNPFDHEFHLFHNFIYLLQNRYFLLGFRNLFSLGLLTVFSALFVSLVLSYLLCLYPRLAKAGTAVLILPVIIPSVSAASVFQLAFDTRSVLADASSRLALVSLFSWKYAGLGSVILLAALKRIPQSILDAARIDGANGARMYFSVHLPCISGEIAFTLFLYIMFMLRLYKESYLLFGSYPSGKVYMLQNYMNHQYTGMNFQYVAASAVLLVAFSLAMYALAYLCLQGRRKRL